ncbi:putative RNA-directed DNA polymerase, eukaryota, reverse transcriptase zinc-binding domain protein [Tanacetum coccineum]
MNQDQHKLERKIVKNERLDVIGIQETKITSFDPSLLRNLWGTKNVDFVCLDSIGQSGGILLSWNSSSFAKEGSFSGSHLYGAYGVWQNVSTRVCLVNVYGPQLERQKEALWAELSHLVSSLPCIWVIFGDFNVVRCSSERVGSMFSAREASCFNDFIACSGLHDLSMGGQRFTWFNKKGTKMSKLDLYLVSNNFFDVWPNTSVNALNRVISDHNPLLLKAGITVDYGPRPFRVFDHRLKCPLLKQASFLSSNTRSGGLWSGGLDSKRVPTVTNMSGGLWSGGLDPKRGANRDQHSRDQRGRWFFKGWGIVMIPHRPSSYQKTSWSSNQYNGVADIVLKNKFKQLKLDIKAWCGKRKLADLENKARLNNILEKWELKAETCFISQEDIDAREEAIMELLMLNQQDSYVPLRTKSHEIKWLYEGDEIIPSFIHSSNQKKKNKEPRANRPIYRSSRFRILNDSDTLGLISPFSEEEVKAAVWSCSGSKSPGPDGMNFNFIKRHWELVKDDFMMCFKQFEQSGRLARGVNPSFIILVPKTKDSLEISKYRPISLIGCIYKVISKALANRLAKVMHQIISPDQTAFISRRQILDGVLIANEVINYAIKWAWSWFSLRLTSRKLLIVLPGVSCLISWNKWGFSQKALQVMIMDAYDLGIFKGLSLQEDGASLSLLQYADDALFLVNGLATNLTKSTLYGIGVHELEVASVAATINCKSESLPFMYLVVKAIHGPKCDFSTQVGEGLCRGTWESIIRSGSAIDNMSIPFKKSFSKRIGDGNDTLFWKYVWVNEGVCLKDRFPHLFALESNKDCKISERWCQVNGVWSGAWNWRALPRGRGVDDLANLINVVGPLTLTEDSRDGWKWNLDPSNKFTVKRLSFLIDDKLLAPFALGRNHSWNNWIPRKVNVAVWRAANNRLPTMSCLSSRGVVVSSSLCPLCECAQESIEHTLCECPLHNLVEMLGVMECFSTSSINN